LPSGFRYSHFEGSRELFGEAIRLRASSVDQRCAGLDLAERSRATMWPESAASRRSPDIEALVKQIPDRTDVVYYTLTAGETFAWVLSRNRCETVRLETGGREIERLVGLLLRRIQQHADTSRVLSTSGELYDRLILPLRSRLTPGACLVVVADGALHRLPFALLRTSGGFLIEERAILIATSLTGFVEASHRLSQAAGTIDRALIVADPATSEAEPLPGARSEAVDLASLYSRPIVLTGHAATKRAVWDAIPGADVLHYAGHSLDDPLHPDRSRLLLVRTTGEAEEGSLSVKDLFALPRPVPSLVVLAACRTRGGRVYRGQGSLGLSTPFPVKGAPSVVATLWAHTTPRRTVRAVGAPARRRDALQQTPRTVPRQLPHGAVRIV
jgi:CHAT domain-containing protein